MKLRASTKILFRFIGLVGLVYIGNYGYTKLKLQGVDLNPIPSSDFCLLAIGPKAGVRTIVANQMVQIVESSDQFKADESREGGAESGSVKKRIPVKELVGVLGGDVESAEIFVRKMRDINEENENIDEAPIWTKEDVEKALNGDSVLQPKLCHDLNVTKDGKPEPILNRLAFFYGIRIKIPITLKAPNAKGLDIKTVDVVNFKPRFMSLFYKDMQTKFYSKSQLQNYYTSFIRDASLEPQDLKDTLKKVFIRTEESDELKKASWIASHALIVVNQPMVESVAMETQNDGGVKTYDLKIRLSPEGKNRLWKFSADGGTQILVVSKGVAIAAATIGTQLNSQELVIKQIADQRLVEEAVSLVSTKK